MALRRRGSAEQLNPWPGYVDALSTLLMVIIFVLLVFVLAQAFLSVALSGRDRALDRVNRQMAELTDMLSLERGRTRELQLSIAQLSTDLRTAAGARDALAQQLAAVRGDSERATAERDSLRGERDRLSARLADADLQAQSNRARTEQLQGQIADLAQKGDAVGQTAARTAAGLAATQKDLAARVAALADAQRRLDDMQRQLAEMRAQAEAADRVVKADRATIEARVSDLARMAEQMRALSALRDELERQAQDAAARATTEQQRREAVAAQLGEERKFSDSARAQLALLTQQVRELRAQLATVAGALDASQSSTRDKDAQIANLGARLNAALAQRVEELQQYRSDFFGRLREVLANRPGITVVGDRFVFQSEVLFGVGSAELTGPGQDQINQLATTLKQIGSEIPKDVNWVLRVDGHADRQPLATGRFASNWELSAGRAITVVKLLIADGIPANRLAATGFADYQPLDASDTPDAYAKNRRIEIRLTDR